MSLNKSKRKKSTTNPFKQNISSVWTEGRNRFFHFINMGVLAALLIALWLFTGPLYYQTSISYVTENPLLVNQSSNLVPAEQIIREIDARWVASVLFGIGLVYSLAIVTRWSKSYERSQKDRIYLWRWVYFALAGAVGIKIINIAGGVQDLATLKLSSGMVVLAAAFAWLSERQNLKGPNKNWSNYILATVAASLSVIPVLLLAIGTSLYGGVSLPGHVYWLIIAGITAFSAIGANLAWSIKLGKKANYSKVERNYVLIALLAQVILAVILIIASRV